jgi:hypothetical protein
MMIIIIIIIIIGAVQFAAQCYILMSYRIVFVATFLCLLKFPLYHNTVVIIVFSHLALHLPNFLPFRPNLHTLPPPFHPLSVPHGPPSHSHSFHQSTPPPSVPNSTHHESPHLIFPTPSPSTLSLTQFNLTKHKSKHRVLVTNLKYVCVVWLVTVLCIEFYTAVPILSSRR